MSLIHEFYAGNREAILAALKGADGQALEDPRVVFAKAEWGSHLYDTHLDLLMEATRNILRGPLKTWQGAWETMLLNDAGDTGHFAAAIKGKVVEMFARCDEGQIQHLAEDWGRRMMLDEQEQQAEMRKAARAGRVDDWVRRIVLGVGFLAPAVMVPWALGRAGHPLIGWLVAIVAALLAIALAAMLWSRRRRKPPRPPTDPEALRKNLRSHLEDLQRVCRVALDRGSPLIYHFSL